MSSLTYSPMTSTEFNTFWPTFRAIVAAEETYAIDPRITREEAFHLWCSLPLATYSIKDSQEQLLGTYYLKANAAGPGKHICNCGYMVSTAARGQGVARSMCEHSQIIARELGFEAMQFNAVVSTNEVAVALWQRLGFTTVGTVPKSFRHATHGLVDTFVMYKPL